VHNAPPFNEARTVESVKQVIRKGRCSGPFEETRNKNISKFLQKVLTS